MRAFDAFRHRDFRLLWSGQAVSLIGDAAFFTALGWRAFTLVGSSRLGIVFLAQAIGLLATLAAVDASGQLTFTALLVLTLLNGSATASSSPPSAGSFRSSWSRAPCRRRTA